MAANTEILRDGIASGLTAPRIVAERTIAQIERMLAVPIESAIVPSMVKVASEEDRERVRDAVRDTSIRPTRRSSTRSADDYSPRAARSPGSGRHRMARQIYRTAIRSWTTLDLDPQEVHQIGLDDLASIEDERREISRRAGFGDDTGGVSSVARRRCREHAADEGRAGRPGNRGHRASPCGVAALLRRPAEGSACEVRPVEEYKEKDAPFAYYYPPAPDGSRPGIYYANGYDLPSRKYTKLATTTFHEAAPGHHFQITLEMENPHLNTFRRLGARAVGGAYVEGWGLYSERLADEMGLFRDEGERFGMLDAQAWRAARLVVDTGLHALRWPRQRSIDFLRGAGLSETDAVIETDRYIAWPGQALTYKIGQREIERLRAELSRRDGSAFDLRAFHDALLGHGSLPLATLARELPNWLATPV